MSTSAELSRDALLNVVASRGQDVCVAYVNGVELGPRIEDLFSALSRLQEFDDRHTDNGPAETRR